MRITLFGGCSPDFQKTFRRVRQTVPLSAPTTDRMTGDHDAL